VANIKIHFVFAFVFAFLSYAVLRSTCRHVSLFAFIT